LWFLLRIFIAHSLLICFLSILIFCLFILKFVKDGRKVYFVFSTSFLSYLSFHSQYILKKGLKMGHYTMKIKLN
jgi:hypothetical protein